MSGELSVQAVAATATFVASLLAGVFALVNLTLSKEQKVSEFRQAWIDHLREDLSRFFALLHYLGGAANTASILGSEEMQLKLPDVVKQRPILDAEAWELLMRIKLRLNTTEAAHIELLRLLVEARHRASAIGRDVSPVIELERMIKDASDFARPVLKSEWEVVKKGEPVFRYIRIFGLPAILLIAAIFIILLSCGARSASPRSASSIAKATPVSSAT